MYQSLYLKLLVLTVNPHLKHTQTAQTFPLESESAILWPLVENTPSLLLALTRWRVRLVGGVAAFPQQRGAEDDDDAHVEDEAGDQHPDGPQEGGHHSVSQEPRPPWRHVCHHALHLEVGPHHGADVEELVAVAKVVEAAWGQPLREVGGKQETGEEGKEEVITVTVQGVAWAAVSPAAQKDPVKQRNGVKYKRNDKRSCSYSFTSLWEL